MAARRVRRTTALVLVCCATCAGCADTGPAPSPEGAPVSLHATPLATVDDSFYSRPPARLRELAGRFVTTVAGYDSRSEARDDFQARLLGLATRLELHRLTEAPRSRWPWPVLRQRAERNRVRVSGVSETQDAGHRRLLIVEVLLTTTTDFARVRDHEEFRLTPTRTRGRWLIDRASGPGL